ncbi:MAG: hypothetical protein ACR2MS_07015 [Weeksellaceae bacterium]
MKYLPIYIVLFVILFSCKDASEISSGQAISMVEDYMENNPIFETGKFHTDKMKLNARKDESMLSELQKLENDGYIIITDQKKRKKWFSSDSIFTIIPTLTEKSFPYVVKQNKNNVEVKTIKYRIDGAQKVTFERKTDHIATFNVILLKEKTPFYTFGKDSNPNSDFITRKFKAKYEDETGWKLVK